jgi:formyl-CoA transferase
VVLQDGTHLDTVGFAWESSQTPGSIRLPPPRLGEHTADILAELRLTRSELADLQRCGVLCGDC